MLSLKPYSRMLYLSGASIVLTGLLALLSISVIYIAYNGVSILMLMLLVVGIGHHRRARRGVDASDTRLPPFWPLLAMLMAVFMTTTDSLTALEVVKISFL